MLECIFWQCFNGETNLKIGNFNVFTFFIVFSDEKAAISSAILENKHN